MESLSGVGVLDKAVAVLGSLEAGPRSLAEVVASTGLSRATAHRLAVALEVHGLVRRDREGRFALGLRLIGLGHAAAEAVPGWVHARPALEWLRDRTGESVQLFVRDGDQRVCVESLEGAHELRTIVPVGARLPLGQGSGGRALTAPPATSAAPATSVGPAPAVPPAGSTVRAGGASGHGGSAPAGTESRGERSADGVPVPTAWFESVAERAPGVASVSAPVHGPDGRVVAAVSVSGPVDRTTRRPGARYGAAVVEAAGRISARLA